MPKSSNKNNSSKIKRTFAWFKPTSAKKGMLLFALAFAVIGGGYSAYKALASTHLVIYYPDTKLPDGSFALKCSGDCTSNFVDGNGKISYDKTVVPRADRLNVKTPNAILNTSYNFSATTSLNQVIMCAEMRAQFQTDSTGNITGSGTGAYLKIWTDINNIAKSDPYPVSIISVPTYQRKCTKPLTVTIGNHILYGSIEKSAGNDLYITNVSLDTP